MFLNLSTSVTAQATLPLTAPVRIQIPVRLTTTEETTPVRNATFATVQEIAKPATETDTLTAQLLIRKTATAISAIQTTASAPLATAQAGKTNKRAVKKYHKKKDKVHRKRWTLFLCANIGKKVKIEKFWVQKQNRYCFLLKKRFGC